MITCTFEDGGTGKLRHAVVDAMIIKDGKVLMVKRTSKLSEGGKWGRVGGYMELNERISDAVAREVYEETGWKIENITLFRIIDNPNRPGEDRQTISFVHIAEPVEQTGEPDWESDEVKWWPLNALPARDQIAFDHADNLDLYKRYIKEKLKLPILA